jgi:hypothetical protein
VKLLLDGQQRMTTLYGIVRGRPPKFFDGNESAFANLFFSVEEELFEFYAPIKMKGSPEWIAVTEIMKGGLAGFMAGFAAAGVAAATINTYVTRLNAVAGIRDIDFHIDEVVGEDKTVDVVVDIFNRVNSGGTKLSSADLALARVCAESPEARDDMKSRLEKWTNAGYDFTLAFFLRTINVIATGEAKFAALKDVNPKQFRDGLNRSEKALDAALNTIASRLGLDHARVLGAPGALPVLAFFIDRQGGQIHEPRERDRILFWYLHALMAGRYASSTETVLNQDLEALESGGTDSLIAVLRQSRGSLEVQPDHFIGSSIGARYYPLMCALTRVAGALDWETGDEIRHHMLGRMNQLEVHHIFPKARLYEAGYQRKEVNALANFAFLTKETNLKISAKDPAQYLHEYAQKDPGLLASNWIPLDEALWQVDRYPDFLAARRTLLAGALNSLLDGLLRGSLAEPVEPPEGRGPRERELVGATSITTEDEYRALFEASMWARSKGLPQGSLVYEATDSDGDVLAQFDLAWPEGIQPGLSQPIALLLDEDQETEQVANSLGFRFFTTVEAFKTYVEVEILGEEPVASGGNGQ